MLLGQILMVTRTTRKSVTFVHPFFLKDVGRILAAGEYEVVTDEELIEGLSFPAYRRVSTMMVVPAPAPRTSSLEMLTIAPDDLQATLARDAATQAPLANGGAGFVSKKSSAGSL